VAALRAGSEAPEALNAAVEETRKSPGSEKAREGLAKALESTPLTQELLELLKGLLRVLENAGQDRARVEALLAGVRQIHAQVVAGYIHTQNNYFGGAAPGAVGGVSTRPTFAQLVEKARPYLVLLASESGKLPLRGLDPKASDPTQAGKLGLDAVYTGLDTTSSEEVDAGKGEKKTVPISALRAVIDHARVVLLGDPGSGKTTFLSHLSLCLARHHFEGGEWLKRLPGWPERLQQLIPVVVTLRRFMAWHRKVAGAEGAAGAEVVWRHLEAARAKDSPGEAIEGLRQAAEQGWVLFILDGLDEVPTRDDRKFVRDCAMALGARYPKARLVLTCRTIPYQDKELQWTGVSAFELRPFGTEQIRGFVNAWFKAHEGCGMAPDQAKGKAGKLLLALLDPHRLELRRLAGNPMLLTVMVLLQTNQRELPEHRAELYKEVIELLLRRWHETRSEDGVMTPGIPELLREKKADQNDLERVLWKLAWEAQVSTQELEGRRDRSTGSPAAEGAAGVADIPGLRLLEELARLSGKPKDYGWADRVVEAIKERTGLLLPSEEDVFRFPHRSFQEYFAAAHLLDQQAEDDKVVGFPSNVAVGSNSPANLASRDDTVVGFPSNIAPLVRQAAYWREVIRWTAGLAAHVWNRPNDALALLDELLSEGEGPAGYGWERVWLAGEALHEIRVAKAERSSRGRRLSEQIRARLVQLVEDPGQPLPIQHRARAGVVLGYLGDPRPGVAPNWPPTSEAPFFTWGTRVEAGTEFEMGGDPVAFEGKASPSIRFTAPFRLARYLVTNAQYDAFEASVYFRAKGLQPRVKDDPRFLSPNQPVVNVPWHDAMHFCAWISEELAAGRILPEWVGVSVEDRLLSPQWQVRLPTEAEWEVSARGAEGRFVPWAPRGQEDAVPLRERCNMGETGLREASVVGLFPQGVSPAGCLDLIGNVWEWTRSEYSRQPYDQPRQLVPALDSREIRVLRGGSWVIEGREYLRCATRLGLLPDARIDAVGFRCVLVGGLVAGG
jgi:formylglycine-generating enzyme required for sulfatase activity